MVKFFILFFILIFINSFSQDTLSDKQLKLDNSVMFGITSVPLFFIYNMSDFNTKSGTIIHITSGAATISCLSIMLVNSKGKNISRNTCFILAGFLDGFNQELLFHYSKVKDKLPYLNDQYFDPSISWKNKYESNILFSETLLVGLTDGYHLTRTLNKGFVIGGVLLLDYKKGSFKRCLKQFGIGSCLYVISKGIIHQAFKN